MFVLNFKLNSNFLLKLILVIFFIIVLSILGFSIYKLFSNTTNDHSYLESSNTFSLTTSNYTNVLKAVHNDLDTYLGQQITFSGYVYRVFDLEDSQFVLARDMIIDSNKQTLVVGFLCHSDNASSYKSGTWVNITGTITKGDYHGEIPIIEITDIKEIKKPSDEYVYPPDETYVPTSTVL